MISFVLHDNAVPKKSRQDDPAGRAEGDGGEEMERTRGNDEKRKGEERAKEREHEDEKQRAEGMEGHEDGQRRTQLDNSCSERPGSVHMEVKHEENETVCSPRFERHGTARSDTEALEFGAKGSETVCSFSLDGMMHVAEDHHE